MNKRHELDDNDKWWRVGLVVAGGGDEHFDPGRSSYEKPARIAAITNLLQSEQWALVLPNLVHLTSTTRQVDDAELLAVHSKSYLAKLRRLTGEASTSHADCNVLAQDEFESIYMNKNSLQAAQTSAGAALALLDCVLDDADDDNGGMRVGAAAIRPPGHHAENHCAMGFCFFNNAALVARRALDHFALNRVLIVDFDIHHGNATQRAFANDSRVVYFSVHRWDHGAFFPSIGQEAACGVTGSAGHTINVAFSDGEMGDLEYQAVVEHVLQPVVRDWRPELVVFSAGFDVLHGDPIGRYHVSPHCLGSLVHHTLSSSSSSRAVLVLEGGYSVKATAEGFAHCVRAMHDLPLGRQSKYEQWNDSDDASSSSSARIKPQAVDAINATVAAHAAYWPGMRPITIGELHPPPRLVSGASSEDTTPS